MGGTDENELETIDAVDEDCANEDEDVEYAGGCLSKIAGAAKAPVLLVLSARSAS